MLFTTIITFILVLSVLVFLHEFGHYAAARLCGVRVEQFSIGFPPKAFGRKIGETEYMVGWLPLGGFVRLWGQNLHDEDLNDPTNYAAKSKKQRFFILVGGPIMNLITAVLFLSMYLWWGEKIPSHRFTTPVVAQVETGSVGERSGFMPKDKIVSVQGQPTPTWNAVFEQLREGMARLQSMQFMVQRQERTLSVQVDPALLASGKLRLGLAPIVPAEIGAFSADSAARAAGLQVGDRLLQINHQAIAGWSAMAKIIQQHAQASKPLQLKVERGSQTLTLAVTPKRHSSGRLLLGISPGVRTIHYGFGEGLSESVMRLTRITGQVFVFLGQLLQGKSSLDSLGGPVKIGAALGGAAQNSLQDLLFLTAIISLQLGVFNLLPIPALDGGHIAMLGVEWLKGSPLNAKWRIGIQSMGMVLLLTLMAVVTLNDVLQIFG